MLGRRQRRGRSAASVEGGSCSAGPHLRQCTARGVARAATPARSAAVWRRREGQAGGGGPQPGADDPRRLRLSPDGRSGGAGCVKALRSRSSSCGSACRGSGGARSSSICLARRPCEAGHGDGRGRERLAARRVCCWGSRAHVTSATPCSADSRCEGRRAGGGVIVPPAATFVGWPCCCEWAADAQRSGTVPGTSPAPAAACDGRWRVCGTRDPASAAFSRRRVAAWR